MEPKTLKINDVEYIQKDEVSQPLADGEALRIIMNNDRGLCLVGWCSLDENSWLTTIRDARCVIKWGTSGHLAELAKSGPLSNTKLGHKNTQTIPTDKIGLIIDCEASKWQ